MQKTTNQQQSSTSELTCELSANQLRQEQKEKEQREDFLRIRARKADEAHLSGRSSQTDGGRGVRSLIVPQIAKWLEAHDEWVASQPSRAGMSVAEYRRIKSWVCPETIAHIGVSCVLDALGRGNSLRTTLTTCVINIGKHLEDQAFMAYMEATDFGYFEKLTTYYLNDPVRRYDKKVYGMRRALEKSAEMSWDWMSKEDHARVGSLVLRAINSIIIDEESGEGFFEIRQPEGFTKRRNPKHKDARYIGFTVTGLKYRDKLQEAADLGCWKPLPMVCEPLPWQLDESGDVVRGGYLRRVPGEQGQLIHRNKGSKPSQMVLDALNRLQNTGYKVNTYILEVMQDLIKYSWEIGSWVSYEKLSYEDEHKPLVDSEHLDTLSKDSDEYKETMRGLMSFYHDQRIEEKKAATPRRTLEIAQEFKDEEAFYIPWFLDTRGRLYPVVEGLSPQGPDWQKALLRSATPVPINEDTRRDLLISIATAGAFKDEEGVGLDKRDFFTRLQWAEEFVNSAQCHAMVEDPTSVRFWHDADEPWQFLAFCREFYEIFVWQRKAVCDVFVFRDATNSGLQILAGLMRDEKSATYTNVTITDEPMDAYRLVADTAKELMKNENWMKVQFEKRSSDITAKNLKRDKDQQIEDRGTTFEFPIDELNRAHTKTQVMTTLYNSSPLTRRENIIGALKKKSDIVVHPGDKSIVVNACLQSMSTEFEKALELNKWFQKVAKAAMDAGKDMLEWHSPSGMYVVNEYREPLYSRVATYAQGGGHYAKVMKNDKGQVVLIHGYGDVKPSKVLSSTSANFIHSLDASVIVLGLLNVPDGIPVFTVHDCCACIPGTVSKVIPEFRKAFLNVVTSNPLEGLLESNELLGQIEVPKQGDAPIEECIESPYMFS